MDDLVAEAMSRPDTLHPRVPGSAGNAAAFAAICRFDFVGAHRVLDWAAPYQDPIFAKAQAALQKGFGKKAVFIREGGSIPFVTQMYDTFKVPCVLLGFGLPDENAHAPDEWVSLSECVSMIEIVRRTVLDFCA